MMTVEHSDNAALHRDTSCFRDTREPIGQRLDGMELQVHRLKRELRLYRLGFIAAFAIIGLIVVGGAAGRQDSLEEVRAQRFAVVDQKGRVKAYFSHSGTSTSLQIGADGQGIRMEHGAQTNALQLITPAYTEKEVEGFQSNSLTLHNDPYNSGVLIINPGTREDENSRGRVWLSTLKGYELSREMF